MHIDYYKKMINLFLKKEKKTNVTP